MTTASDDETRDERARGRAVSAARIGDGRVVVTGGAGFIGSAVVWALNARGFDDVIVVDRLGVDEKWRNLAPLRFDDFVDADDFLAGAERDPEAWGDVRFVFHLGACSATTERDAGFLLRNNYEYTKKLAHWAIARDARFVYASSAATYGDGTEGMDDREERPERFRPLNAYGYSKHLFDLYARRRGLLDRIVGLKYFNVFGPNEDHKGDMRSVVHKAFGQVRETGAMKLFQSANSRYRDGEFGRDFVYVKDAVAATLFLAEAPAASGIFNVGAGVEHTWLDLARAIFRALDLEPRVEFVPMPEHLRATYQYTTRADVSKLVAAGYDRTPGALEATVAEYVREYLVPGRHLGDESGAAESGPA